MIGEIIGQYRIVEWKQADPELPDLTEARRALSRE